MKRFLLVFIVLLTGGLFIGGPNHYDNPIIKEFWESGHFVLFFFLSFYLFTYSKLNRIEKIKRSAIILGALLVLGLLTEAIQLLVGRNFEAKDLLNDLLGTLSGLLVPFLNFRNNLSRLAPLLFLFASLVFFSQTQLLSTVFKEIKLRQDFPVLSDFEAPLQLDRWKVNTAALSISDSKTRKGKFSMRAELLPGKFPGVELWHLNGNWQNYQFLEFSIYLDAPHPINLILKVYDRQHPNNAYDYNDRFDRRLSVNPGWNDFSVPLHLIEKAPTERSMDMKNILSLSLFTINLKNAVTLYIDSVQLAKEP